MNGLNFAISHTPTHSCEMNLANKIDQAMRTFKPKLTQTGLAKLSGVPQATISRTLKGKTLPEFDTLSRLAKALKIEIDGFDLVTGEEIRPHKRNISDVLSAKDTHLLKIFNKLNDAGKNEVISFAEFKVNDQSDSKGHTPTKKSRKAA
jgi:transcriptional regulator with XRE-family HTH domain